MSGWQKKLVVLALIVILGIAFVPNIPRSLTITVEAKEHKTRPNPDDLFKMRKDLYVRALSQIKKPLSVRWQERQVLSELVKEGNVKELSNTPGTLQPPTTLAPHLVSEQKGWRAVAYSTVIVQTPGLDVYGYTGQEYSLTPRMEIHFLAHSMVPAEGKWYIYRPISKICLPFPHDYIEIVINTTEPIHEYVRFLNMYIVTMKHVVQYRRYKSAGVWYENVTHDYYIYKLRSYTGRWYDDRLLYMYFLYFYTKVPATQGSYFDSLFRAHFYSRDIAGAIINPSTRTFYIKILDYKQYFSMVDMATVYERIDNPDIKLLEWVTSYDVARFDKSEDIWVYVFFPGNMSLPMEWLYLYRLERIIPQWSWVYENETGSLVGDIERIFGKGKFPLHEYLEIHTSYIKFRPFGLAAEASLRVTGTATPEWGAFPDDSIYWDFIIHRVGSVKDYHGEPPQLASFQEITMFVFHKPYINDTVRTLFQNETVTFERSTLSNETFRRWFADSAYLVVRTNVSDPEAISVKNGVLMYFDFATNESLWAINGVGDPILVANKNVTILYTEFRERFGLLMNTSSHKVDFIIPWETDEMLALSSFRWTLKILMPPTVNLTTNDLLPETAEIWMPTPATAIYYEPATAPNGIPAEYNCIMYTRTSNETISATEQFINETTVYTYLDIVYSQCGIRIKDPYGILRSALYGGLWTFVVDERLFPEGTCLYYLEDPSGDVYPLIYLGCWNYRGGDEIDGYFLILGFVTTSYQSFAVVINGVGLKWESDIYFLLGTKLASPSPYSGYDILPLCPSEPSSATAMYVKWFKVPLTFWYLGGLEPIGVGQYDCLEDALYEHPKYAKFPIRHTITPGIVVGTLRMYDITFKILDQYGTALDHVGITLYREVPHVVYFFGISTIEYEYASAYNPTGCLLTLKGLAPGKYHAYVTYFGKTVVDFWISPKDDGFVTINLPIVSPATTTLGISIAVVVIITAIALFYFLYWRKRRA